MPSNVPKYQIGDYLLDNNGRVIFEVVDFIENTSIIWRAKYLYALKNLTEKRKDYDVMDEDVIAVSTTKLTSSAVQVLFGTNTALE